MNANNAPGALKQITAAEKRQKLVALRLKGHSMEDIRRALGYSHGGVYKALHVALEERRETMAADVAELRQIEEARLDKLLIGLAPAIGRGDPTAILRAIEISARRSRLLGLDATTKMELSGKDGGPIGVEVARTRIAEKLAQFTKAEGPTEVSGEPE